MAWLKNEDLFFQLVLSAYLSFFTEKGVQPCKVKEFFTEKSKMINHFVKNIPLLSAKYLLVFY